MAPRFVMWFGQVNSRRNTRWLLCLIFVTHFNTLMIRDSSIVTSNPRTSSWPKTGSVKIADFGLSRIVGNENQATNLTQTHQVLGTPRYMAPEQFEGSHRVDHRADIYSLGVVFYEMLTGELPIGRFEAPSQKVQIDVRLDEVVLRTLEREPQRRYQAASEIKSDLQSISSTREYTITPTMVHGTREDLSEKAGMPVPAMSLDQQETAARLLLSRRELMDRVRNSPWRPARAPSSSPRGPRRRRRRRARHPDRRRLG